MMLVVVKQGQTEPGPKRDLMLTTVLQTNYTISPVGSPTWCQTGLFCCAEVDTGRPWNLLEDFTCRGRNFTAMRDQNFQDQMSKVDHFLVDGTPDNVQGAKLPADGKADFTEEQLSKQESFSRFIKRKFPSRKASPELIQSIKDRIKMLDSQ